jgi:cytochrome P450
MVLEPNALKPHPPGPDGHLLLGSAIPFQRDPLGYLLGLTQTYGDILRYRYFFWYSYLVNHPDYIGHILQENNRNYSKDIFSFRLLKVLVGEGLLTSDGDFWLKQRRMIQPAFHRRKIASFGEMMTESTNKMLARWASRSDPDSPFDLAEEMMALTLEIVGRALFDLNLRGEAESVGEAFTLANRIISELSFNPLAELLIRLPTPNTLRLRRAVDDLDRIVGEIISTRREGGAQGDDLLSMLLAMREGESGERMSDRQLRDEVMTLLLAGHETTALALTWTCYLLSEHPEVESELHAELDRVLGGRTPTIEDLPALTYTKMVIEESMRLYPPAWGFGRLVVERDEIGVYNIPANSIVFIIPYLTHRHPDFWERPEVFDPERFSQGRSQDRPRFAYFPFGGGPRQCIGKDFAMVEARLVLATMAQRYRLRLVPGHPVALEPLITLRPRHGMKMTMERRTP